MHADPKRSKNTQASNKMLMKLMTGYNFINILLVPFWYQSALQSFSITVWLCNFLVKEYWCKSCTENVNEIDYRISSKAVFFFIQRQGRHLLRATNFKRAPNSVL